MQRRLLRRRHGIDQFGFGIEVRRHCGQIRSLDMVEEVDGTFLDLSRPNIAQPGLHLPPIREPVLDRADFQGFDEGRTGWIHIGVTPNPRKPFARLGETIGRLLGEPREVGRCERRSRGCRDGLAQSRLLEKR